MTYLYASEENYKDEEPDMDMGLDENDYDGEEDPDVEGYCIAGANCMCKPYQRARCIDWKQQA